MPNPLLTPYMGLTEPGVGVTLSPTWATDLNNDLNILDSHNHSPGSGIAISPDGMNISTDLTFQSNNAIDLRSARFTAQSNPLSLGTDIGCIYVAGEDLYYNDTLGNQVRITQSGAIAGTPGSISNLTSPASATYSAATSTFIWQSNTGVAAHMDMGEAILRYIGSYASPTGNYIALRAPSTLATGFNITFPATLPPGTRIATIDNNGNIAANINTDDVTIVRTSNLLSVKDNSIGPTQLAAVNYELASSSGSFTSTSSSYVTVTNQNINFTGSGRPVRVELTSDPAGLPSYLGLLRTGATGIIRLRFLLDDTTPVGECEIENSVGGSASVEVHIPSSSMSTIIFPGAGTTNIKLQVIVNTPSTTAKITDARLTIYEL